MRVCREKALMVILLLLCFSQTARAQEIKSNLDEIVMGISRVGTQDIVAGVSATIITKEDIERMGKNSVVELLQSVPGLSISQNGAFGGLSSVFIRGSKNGYTLVMVDGVEVNDPSSPDKSFDFAHLDVDNIERIEIIRGSQSAFYGSAAIGGVINIISKKGKGKPTLNIGLEGGSFGTRKETGAFRGNTDKVNYSFAVSRIDTDGISKADKNKALSNDPEKDAYEKTGVYAQAGMDLSGGGNINFNAQYMENKTEVDDGSYQDDPNAISKQKEFISKVAFVQPINSKWKQKLSLYFYDLERNFRDREDSVDTFKDQQSENKGTNKKIGWEQDIEIANICLLTTGLEYKQETGSSFYRSGTYESILSSNSLDTKGFYLQNQLKSWKNLITALGFRIDDYEFFGTNINYRASLAYGVSKCDLTFKANLGTGFKVPSLYQLYSEYGNPMLKPDESRTIDFGIEKNFLKRKIHIGMAYFNNQFKNMIDWEENEGAYKNIERAETEGIEITSLFWLFDVLTLKINHTYMQTKDKDTGLSLLKRPINKSSMETNWFFLPEGNINVIINYIGKREDEDFTMYSSRRIALADYVKIDVFSSMALTDTIKIFGRIENILNKKYQEVYGFAMPGISFWAGVKIKI